MHGMKNHCKQGHKFSKMHRLNKRKEKLTEKRDKTTDLKKKSKIEERLNKIDLKEKLEMMEFVFGKTKE